MIDRFPAYPAKPDGKPSVLQVARAVSGVHVLLNFIPTDEELKSLYEMIRAGLSR